MVFNIKVSTSFNCSLERAFKTPILCDIAKVHTGYWVMPKITHCTDDSNWGKPGESKKLFAAKSITQKGGYVSSDKVLERVENHYWIIEVSEFQSWALGFFKFVGKWETTEMEQNNIEIEYSYSLHADTAVLYPFQWLFAKIFWRRYMKHALENIRMMAYNSEPYLYE